MATEQAPDGIGPRQFLEKAYLWAPAAAGLVLLVGVFGPGLERWSETFLGRQYVDAWGTQWFYWFVGFQMRHLGGFGWTDLFFYPWGKDIYLHTGGNVLDAIIAWPLRWVFGAVAGYNFWIVLVLFFKIGRAHV